MKDYNLSTLRFSSIFQSSKLNKSQLNNIFLKNLQNAVKYKSRKSEHFQKIKKNTHKFEFSISN